MKIRGVNQVDFIFDASEIGSVKSGMVVVLDALEGPYFRRHTVLHSELRLSE